MATQSEELKKIKADKKALNERQKAIRDSLNETKAERKEVRTAQALARKEIRAQKSNLRELTAKIYSTFSNGDSEALDSLADEITESSATLVGTIRTFAEAAGTLEEL